jgi:hypothetical protein
VEVTVEVEAIDLVAKVDSAAVAVRVVIMIVLIAQTDQ